MSDARPILSTYRLQLNTDFGFDAAREIVPYLARLGVSHLYLSPLLTARPGSTHGYDVADPTTVSPALGGEEGLVALAETAHAHGLGLVVDIVPNHLGIGPENPDWQLLLADGQSGEGARVFDVDWDPPLPTAKGKVILPVLGDQYGKVLANGELRVVEEPDAAGRRFRLRYHEHSFPFSAESLDALDRVGRLESLAGTIGDLPSWHRLHGLIEQQHYRLVLWRAGDRLINYRRFFAISELAGVRVEDEHVFDRTHTKILELVERGIVDGLRIDHPDGLRDPARYLQRLADKTGGCWTIVEKITHPGEPLEPWPVAGTTGYEFCNDVLGLAVDPAAEEPFDVLAAALDADPRPYDEQVAAAKHEVLTNDLAAEIARLSLRFWTLVQQHLEIRDTDDRDCLAALSNTLVGMHVYRAYVDPDTAEAGAGDHQTVAQAIEYALRQPGANPDLLGFLQAVLLGEAGADPQHRDLIARFQQLSGALMAKGVEDTAFYRYPRMVALNEVGGDPATFGLSVAEFHRRNAERATKHPRGMVSTATHDTKRGEDVRLRIAALTQMPQRWAAVATTLARAADIDGPTTSLLLQSVVGVWPLLDSGERTGDLAGRLGEYARKAARESGLHTNWHDPNEAYEQRLVAFIDTLLNDGDASKQLAEVAGAAAEIGMVAGLAQVVLRTLSPGVPDTYQGNELWDDSLVDPDNRRPVDWALRRDALDRIAEIDPRELWEHRRDGGVKLRVLHEALQLRRALPGLVSPSAGYEPVEASGTFWEHVVAFARSAEGSAAVVAVAPRLPAAVMGEQFESPVGDRWRDTAVALPPGVWRNVLGASGGPFSGAVAVAELFDAVPVALLVPAP